MISDSMKRLLDGANKRLGKKMSSILEKARPNDRAERQLIYIFTLQEQHRVQDARKGRADESVTKEEYETAKRDLVSSAKKLLALARSDRPMASSYEDKLRKFQQNRI